MTRLPFGLLLIKARWYVVLILWQISFWTIFVRPYMRWFGGISPFPVHYVNKCCICIGDFLNWEVLRWGGKSQTPPFARLLQLKWAGGGVAWTVHSQLLLSDFSLLVPRNFASDFYILATISHLVEIRKTTCKLISELNTDIKHYHTENGKCVQIELCFNAFNKHRKNCECCPVSQLIVR